VQVDFDGGNLGGNLNVRRRKNGSPAFGLDEIVEASDRNAAHWRALRSRGTDGCAVCSGRIQNKVQGISMPEAFVVTPVTRPGPLDVVGEQITVLARGSRTGGYVNRRVCRALRSSPAQISARLDRAFDQVADASLGRGDRPMKAVRPQGACVTLSARNLRQALFSAGKPLADAQGAKRKIDRASISLGPIG
jgi:hypothetical protein